MTKKFSVTQTETQIPDMPTLPNTQGVNDLSLQEIRQDITKMKSNKACGPDGIPIEIFKGCPTCMTILTKLLHKI